MNAKTPQLQRILSSGALGNPGMKMRLLALSFVSLASAALVLSGPRKWQNSQQPTREMTKEFAAPLQVVLQALNELLEDQAIHGIQTSEKEPNLTGATRVKSSPLFEPWKGDGKVFYKIRKQITAPAHFAESADQGTIAVRYIVTDLGLGRTSLRIDAIYFDTAHGTVHASDGTVEDAECKAFEDRLQAIQTAQSKAGEPQDASRNADSLKQDDDRQREAETQRIAALEATARDLEHQANTLLREVEKSVKAPGSELRAGPYRTAAVVQALPTSTIVAILVVSPHWYVVQTPGGRRGWIPQDQLENLP
jgi:hypothetical protein